MVGRTNAVTEPACNTTGSNNADNNADTCCIVQKIIPIADKNWSVGVYPYSGEYEPIDNVPIVSGDTSYDHTDGNTYILVLHESLYYVSQMKHSLINPNQIRSNGLDFYEKHARYEEFYVELDDNLKITLQFKGNKCNFLFHVPTQQEIEKSQNFDMMSEHEWDPQSINLNKI